MVTHKFFESAFRATLGPEFAALSIPAQEHLTECNSFACRTQLPHAVGAAYAFKMDQKLLCSATYFGEGATSEVCPAPRNPQFE